MRLYEGVECGDIPLGALLKERIRKLESAREALTAELMHERSRGAERVLPSDIEKFGNALRKKLEDRTFAKRYLHLLVDEIRVVGDTAVMRGDAQKLTAAIGKAKKSTVETVPSLMSDWRARHASNV